MQERRYFSLGLDQLVRRVELAFELSHRLNRGGNRQANAALYRAVIVRMRWHPPTIAYVERRTAEGKSKKFIIRCLKRYLLRELYQLLPDASTAPATAEAA